MNQQRFAGKRFVPAFVLLIGVLATVALWQRRQSESESMTILATRTLDDGATLELTHSDDETFEAYLSLRDSDGDRRWRKGIYRLVDPELQGLTLGDGIITIRAGDTRGNYETHAFGREDGKFLWRGGRVETPAPVAKPSERRGKTVIEHYGPPVNRTLRLSVVNGDPLEPDVTASK